MRRCHTPRDERRFVSVRERSRVQLAALQDMNVAIGRQQGQLRAEITIPDKVSDCQTAHLEWNFDLFNTRLAISISPTPPVNNLYFVAHRHGQIGKRIVIQLSQSQRGWAPGSGNLAGADNIPPCWPSNTSSPGPSWPSTATTRPVRSLPRLRVPEATAVTVPPRFICCAAPSPPAPSP